MLLKKGFWKWFIGSQTKDLIFRRTAAHEAPELLDEAM